ncbi:VOC family protein [Nonomuraea lactucae]|uniref:VOC family protein n=1 Tax=Nonomuraea lactucae TaxID=2249762 RepID=UPI000DE49FEF|nr:VOC family protein [Nonomuraea lactucae]
MNSSPITHLRHVGIAVPDYEPAVEFNRGVWGLTPVADDDGVSFFAAEASPEQYILRVRRAPEKRLDLIAFGAEDAASVDALAERLIAAEVRIEREPGELDTPGGGYGLRFFDPEGRLIEISSDVEQRAARPLEPRESIPRRLSHVVINSVDILNTKAFYERHLGFRLSDWLEDKMCFMRTRADHHILAISSGPHVALNHISFEMRGIDEYMRGSGRLIRHGHRPLWGPGRHGAGDNTFTYFLDPNGNVVEYTTELEKIVDDDTWVPRRFEATPEEADQWGTAGLITDAMIPAMFNEPDKGLWTPAPL